MLIQHCTLDIHSFSSHFFENHHEGVIILNAEIFKFIKLVNNSMAHWYQLANHPLLFHLYCRWADDFPVLLKSERTATQVMDKNTGYLENNLNLPVDKENGP